MRLPCFGIAPGCLVYAFDLNHVYTVYCCIGGERSTTIAYNLGGGRIKRHSSSYISNIT